MKVGIFNRDGWVRAYATQFGTSLSLGTAEYGFPGQMYFMHVSEGFYNTKYDSRASDMRCIAALQLV